MWEFLKGRRTERYAVYEKNSARPCRETHGWEEFIADKKRAQIPKNFIFLGCFSDFNNYQ